MLIQKSLHGRGMDIYSGTRQFQKIIAAQDKASAFAVATLICFAPPTPPSHPMIFFLDFSSARGGTHVKGWTG